MSPATNVAGGTCFLNDAAPTEIYTLSLHDALPISAGLPDHDHRVSGLHHGDHLRRDLGRGGLGPVLGLGDRKSTRLNSSHPSISYAVFCLKKKSDRLF